MFVNETKNDIEGNVKASAAMIKKLRLIMIIISVLMTLAGAVWFAFDFEKGMQEETDIYFSLAVLICGVVFLLFWLCFNKIQRKTLEKTMQGKEAIVHFEFRDSDYEIVSTSNDSLVCTTKGNYFAVTECREDKELWLLYFNKATVFLMLKSGMQEGSVEEFTAFLKERLGSRYKVIYKQKK